MLFEIAHTTIYCYSRPVFLDPHTVRLRPRSDIAQSLLHFELEIDPRPAGQSLALDLDGNAVVYAWFEGLTQSLSIKATSKAAVLPLNPFGYILLDPATEKLPVSYAEALAPFLAPYRLRPRASAAVDDFAETVAREVDRETLPFLTMLSRRIHDTCDYVVRENGAPRPAEETLARGEGSCRDLAVLFMDACRARGIAARFVSGYQEGRAQQDRRTMHAWTEVYLPGGGWRGYDPTLGLAVTDRHITLAAAAVSELAAPVSGSFRGTDVSTRFQANIEIHSLAG